MSAKYFESLSFTKNNKFIFFHFLPKGDDVQIDETEDEDYEGTLEEDLEAIEIIDLIVQEIPLKKVKGSYRSSTPVQEAEKDLFKNDDFKQQPKEEIYHSLNSILEDLKTTPEAEMMTAEEEADISGVEIIPDQAEDHHQQQTNMSVASLNSILKYMKSDNLETDKVEDEPIEDEAIKTSDHETFEDSEVIFWVA
jgi:hypothetical protein